jgi:hypothetical protein
VIVVPTNDSNDDDDFPSVVGYHVKAILSHTEEKKFHCCIYKRRMVEVIIVGSVLSILSKIIFF